VVTSNSRWLILSRETCKMENSTHGKLVTEKSVIALHGPEFMSSVENFCPTAMLSVCDWSCLSSIFLSLISSAYSFWFQRVIAGPDPTQWHTHSNTHTHTHTNCGTPLDEGSALRRDSNRTTHNTHKRHIDNPYSDSNLQSQPASGRRPTP